VKTHISLTTLSSHWEIDMLYWTTTQSLCWFYCSSMYLHFHYAHLFSGLLLVAWYMFAPPFNEGFVVSEELDTSLSSNGKRERRGGTWYFNVIAEHNILVWFGMFPTPRRWPVFVLFLLFWMCMNSLSVQTCMHVSVFPNCSICFRLRVERKTTF